jgi:PHP family Zn ribbon phosphoesterase
MEEYIDTHIINAIMQARRGELTITPGYDGLYGEIKFDSQRV